MKTLRFYTYDAGLRLMLVTLLLIGAVTQIGCGPKHDEQDNEEEQQQCTASVIFEEIIVNRDTDPAPINDRWQLQARVTPQFPPNPGNFTQFINGNGKVANQGARLLGPPPQTFTFGPRVLGPKDQRYNLIIEITGKELDPKQENRGPDDTPLFIQQFEIRNILCPNDNQARYKFKQAFVDPQNLGEQGLLEFTIRIDLDP